MSKYFKYTWQRYGGYEVSTRGDARFSAFNARMPDGRSIEEHYQCDVKGYDPGGKNWRAGKGQRALRPGVDCWTEYLRLWTIWAERHPKLMLALRDALGEKRVLSDKFATGPINQAHALSVLLNRMEGS